MMTVRELIEALQVMDYDAEVRLATQPHWPLAFSVRGVVADEWVNDEDTAEPVVWIVEGNHPSQASPYAPSDAWSAC